MRLKASIATALAAATLAVGAPASSAADEYVGYLLATFTDPEPNVFWYLSDLDSPLAFDALNGGQAVLSSTVGMNATRDIFLTTNADRSEFFVIATDLNIDVPDFTWDWAVRHGSHGLVVWRSTDLVNWSEPTLTIIENDRAGMAWAPSAVWNAEEGQYYLFWASRLYSEDDPEHTGQGSNNLIRYTTTRDFITFTGPQDYLSDDNNGIIDQEFQYLGEPGHYARFLKDEAKQEVYYETTTDGLFGTWTRIAAVDEGVYEGATSFADVANPGTYHVLLDNYTELVPFTTTSILEGGYTRNNEPNFPGALKHGVVVPVTRAEYDAVVQAYPFI